jgi:hypothetical protein
MSTRTDFSGEERQLVAGFYRGFRMWLGRQTTGLRSTAYPAHRWQIGVNTAICQTKILLERDGLPLIDCKCISCSNNQEAVKLAYKNRLALFGSHKSPEMSNNDLCSKCGLYAYHMPEMLHLSNAYVPSVSDKHGGYIFGSIKATGSIIFGDLGFRAEHAEVEALYGGANGPALAEEYGVPWFKTQAEMVEYFPFIPLENFPYAPLPESPSPTTLMAMKSLTHVMPALTQTMASTWAWTPFTKWKVE